MKYYLAGPMSGIPEQNYPVFTHACQQLRSMGYEIVSPHETFVCQDAEQWNACLRRDVGTLSGCDGIILLPGWSKSRGARLELHIALTLDMPILMFQNGHVYNIS